LSAGEFGEEIAPAAVSKEKQDYCAPFPLVN